MIKSVSPARLTHLLPRFSDQPIVVVGDLILDEFIWGRVDRISPEAPVPVVQVDRESVRLGGAANVAANLAVLGARPFLVGVAGKDDAGARLLERLEARKIRTDGVLLDPDRRTSVKTRVIAHHQQVCRIDRESRLALSRSLRGRVEKIYSDQIRKSRGIILSDYGKGVLAPATIERLVCLARQADQFMAVDPTPCHFPAYHGVSIITPNKKEAEQASGLRADDEDSLVRVGRALMKKSRAHSLLITRGEEGMMFFEEGEEITIPTMAREVFDVTGAGDTVIATLALAVAAGASVYEGALVANCAAGVAVGKLGTAAVTVEEILSCWDPSSG